MFQPIKHLDPRVAAFDAIGRITDEDYKETLIPKLEQLIEEQGKIRAMLRFGEKFAGYSLHAAIDDAAFGFSHLRDFEKVAVVSDVGWIRNSVSMFAHLSPIPVHLFAADQTDAAFAWLTEDN